MNQPGDDTAGGVPGPSVSAAERERVVAMLTRHYADDRLTEADLEARLDRVYGATTLAELRAVVSDLPEEAEAPAAVPAPSGSGSGASPVAAPRRIAALLSGHEEDITGVVPRRLTIRARLGYVELDLKRATFAPGVTEIDVRSLMGYVQLSLPADVRVESDGHGLFGYFATRGSGSSDPGNPRVVHVMGRATFGFVELYLPRGEVRGRPPGNAGRLGPGEEG